jgi:RNA polymerase sigma-70 factor (ECF subfamily)
VSDLDRLVPSIAAGDARAFGSWLAGSERRVRLSLARFATSVDVEAVVQETLLRVWQLAPRHEPDGRPDSLLRLAIRIARNLAVDELRRKRPEALDDQELLRLSAGDPEPAPEPDPLLRRAIRRCLAALKGRPREVMDSRLRAGGESDTELASALGLTVNAFLQNVVRARRALTDCLASRDIRVEELLR